MIGCRWPSCCILVLALGTGACVPDPEAPLNRARMLASKGRDQEAIQTLRNHLVEHPDAEPARRLLIRLLAASGDLGAARAEIDVLRRRLGEHSPVPWIELGHAFELGHEYEQALTMYDEAAKVAPKDPAGPLTGGLRAARWGELELAEPRLEEATRRDPSNSRAWHALGLVRFHAGDSAGARAAYESGLKASQEDLSNHIGLATLALASDNHREALTHYDAILEVRPRFADAYLGRSLALMKLGQFERARESLERGYRLGANKEVVIRQRALLERLERRSGRGPE